MTIKPLRIGSLTVGFPVLLAPMAGFTDTAFRSLCRRFHCGTELTELANATGLCHGSDRSLFLLETVPEERPVGAHLYGSDAEAFARAAAMVEQTGRFDFVDINAGCPVRRIVARGSGAALMRNPLALERIVRKVRDAVRLPVTVKTRLGLSPDCRNISEVAEAVEAGGANAVFVHARFASDGHRGHADWAALARIKAERGIPVIGNGDVKGPEDAERIFRETGVDGVMIGRGALGSPWVFDQIHAFFAGRAWRPPFLAEHEAIVLDHFTRLVTLKVKETTYRIPCHHPPEEMAAVDFRGHLVRYVSRFKGWKAIAPRIDRIRGREDVLAILHAVYEGSG